MVFKVIVALAVIEARYVPEIVALKSKVAEILMLFVPSALCEILPLVTVASLVVLPPPLLIAGELHECAVPFMVVELSDLEAIFNPQELACTKYITQVTLEVLFVIFCVADQSTRSL